MSQKTKFSCGRDYFYSSNIHATLTEAAEQNFDFISVNLAGPRYFRGGVRANTHETRGEPMTRSDLTLPTSDWSQLIVGKLSNWINLEHPNKEVSCIGHECDYNCLSRQVF